MIVAGGRDKDSCDNFCDRKEIKEVVIALRAFCCRWFLFFFADICAKLGCNNCFGLVNGLWKC